MNTQSNRESQGRAQKWIGASLGFALSLILSIWILRTADATSVIKALGTVSPWAVLATVLIGYLAIPLRACQWRMLLGNSRHVTLGAALRALCLGHLGNCLLPMRGGEFLRAYILSRSSGLPFAKVLASVILARLQDLLPILLLVVLMFTVIPLSDGIDLTTNPFLASDAIVPASRLKATLAVACVVAICVVFGLATFRWWQRTVAESGIRRFSLLAPAVANRLRSLLAQVSNAIGVIENRQLLWGSQGIVLICWLCFLTAPLPLLVSFSLSFSNACTTALAIIGLSTFAHLLPSAPGAIGTFHALCLVALNICNPEIDRDVAIAYTVLAHLISTVSPALPGLVFLPTAWEHVRVLQSRPFEGEDS